MATSRMINTNFWHDTYVIDLDPTEKLLFLYLLTNSQTTLAGIYEISFRKMAFDTGIDKDMCEKIVQRFVLDEKVLYDRGWIVLRNFLKHQRLNPSMRRGVEKVISDLPEWLQDVVSNVDLVGSVTADSTQTVASVGTDSPQGATLNKIKSNLIKSNKTKTRSAGQAVAVVDPISQKYYQVIKAYSLPVRNHNNVKAAIAKMKAEASEEDLIVYLDFLLDKYQHLAIEKKPELSEGMDIHAKRMQIINAVKRTASESNQSTAWRPRSRKS